MSEPRAETPAASAARRRRVFRLLAALLLAPTLVFGLDRLLRFAWYLPRYDDHGVPQRLSEERRVDKGFLRFVPDPLLETHYLPGIRLKLRAFSMITGRYQPYTLATGGLGFRGPAPARPKPPGVLRVIAMGGSSTMGQGVAGAETYVARLGELLRQRLPGRRVEVVNAGVQGYASKQGYRLYARDLRALEPDLLVVAYDVNDGVAPMTVEQVAAWQPPPDRPPPPPPGEIPPDQARVLRGIAGAPDRRWWRDPLHGSGLFVTVTYLRRYWQKARTWQPGAQDDGYAGPLPGQDGRPPRVHRCPATPKLGAVARPWDPHVQWYRGNLQTLDILARRDGVPVIYLSVPVEGFLDLKAAYPYSEVMAELSRGREDRRHVDPAAAFCRHPLHQVMLDYCHPTAQGHALIAKALLPPALALLGLEPPDKTEKR